MATLVFSVVGRLVGGGIGQAIGAVIGNQIDQRLLAPKNREGARLGDFSVQSSSYGAPIPKLFGAVRVAGSVIWATDLVETRSVQSNGKGKPKTNIYSYAASFAVILSARAVSRIGRIWADGNLLRGAAGDFKTQTGFTLYYGGEDQAIDPVIAAHEGIANTSAYRGVAYAVFEDFQLGDYGNRIPSLSFEVFADETPVSVGKIISDLSGGIVDHAAPTLIDGFTVSGDSIRSIAETLSGAVPLSFVDDDHQLIVREAGPAAISIDAEMLGTETRGRSAPRISVERGSILAIPETLSIGYYDAARDYQPGLQSARRDGGARRGARFDLPATISANAAKRFAESRLTEIWAGRLRAKVRLPWRYLGLRAGDRVTLPGMAGVWRIASLLLERMVIELDLVPVSGASIVNVADPGRSLSQSDQAHGPTRIELIDLPPLSDTAPRDTVLAIAAAGVLPGWRRAALLVSNDGGQNWEDIGQTAAPAVIGTSVDALGTACAGLVDRRNFVDVRLLNAAMILSGATDARLLAGANLAILGKELIQFGRATPRGGDIWRLSDLLRGRRGTEPAIAGHAAGERFVLLETESLLLLDPRFARPGVSVMAVGIADDLAPLLASTAPIGAAIAPFSPVHPSVSHELNGDILVRWIRRSREGWAWRDDVDAAIGEESEQYRITLTPQGGTARSFTEVLPHLVYLASERATDQSAGAAFVTFSISQIGQHGVSAPLSLTIAIQ